MGCAVDETWAHQFVEHHRLLDGIQFQRWRAGDRSRRLGPALTVHRCPRQAQAGTAPRPPRPPTPAAPSRRVLAARQSQQRTQFFWASMIASACASRFCARARSRSSWWIRSFYGRAGSGLRPRWGSGVCASSAVTCRRQWVRCEEYSPSRRSLAPSSPSGKPAARVTILRL